MKPTNTRSEEAGYVLVTVALLLFVLMGFVALAVDMGILYSARTAAQRAADSAALAGALVFAVDTTPQESDIKAKAIASAMENAIFGNAVAVAESDVSVDMVNRRVTVNVKRTEARGNPVSTYFAGLFVDSADIAVQATAEASPIATSSNCPKPWMIPSTAFHPDTISPCDACLDTWVAGDHGIPVGGPRALLDRAGNVTPFARYMTGQLGAQTPAIQFIIKPQDPSNALVPSNFYPIQVSGTGAAVYRSDISSCGDNVRCGAQYTVETGNMVGPTQQGVRDLVSIENRRYSFINGEHQYLSDGGHRAPNPQLTAVPVWNACADPFFTYDASVGQCPAEVVAPGTGTWYTVDAFAQIFVEGIQGQGVEVRLVDLTICRGNNGPSVAEAGPLAIPVRLVRVPEEQDATAGQ
jgi:Flp pilus assembly protein TadG